jgi:2'-5' RNA ligase
VADPDDKSSLVILVPEADPLVGTLRAQFDLSAICGLSAHITVLFPFARPERLSSDHIDAIGELFAKTPRFSFALEGVCGFPGVVYLAPGPCAPFDALTRAAAARFPEFPPYRGLHPEPIPHLTVAVEKLAGDLEPVVTDLLSATAGRLPLACTARSIALAVKRSGRWSIEAEFPLV